MYVRILHRSGQVGSPWVYQMGNHFSEKVLRMASLSSRFWARRTELDQPALRTSKLVRAQRILHFWTRPVRTQHAAPQVVFVRVSDFVCAVGLYVVSSKLIVG